MPKTQEHTPSPTPERAVYGFVLYVTSLVAFGLYLMWAYIPDSWLYSIGLTYWPQKYWAVALPVYFASTFVLSYVAYTGLIFMTTLDITDVRSVTDSKAIYEPKYVPHKDSIPPLQDLDISVVNRILYMPKEST